MIHDMEFFEQIEAYCQNELSEELKKEFETELHKNPKLRKELELHIEVQDAIMENDVLTLREKLGKVAQQGKSENAGNGAFELFDEFSNIEEITEVMTSEELINFYESLPKVHAYHHEATSKETIHQFYKEQQHKAELENLEEGFEDFDMDFEGLEEAILEKDILNLRQTLKQVAKSVEPQFTVEEIDDFINGELSGNELIEFEKDFIQSRSLREEVQLHQDLEDAVREYEIMELRNKLSGIVETETSWNVSEKNIEDYIDGILEGKELEEFMEEFRDNTDLKAEVKLRKQVNELLGESDIAALRKEMITAKEKAEVKKVKMFVPETKVGKINFWRSSVAVIIILIGITGYLNTRPVSVDEFYQIPDWSTERSVSEDAGDYMLKAQALFMAEDWSSTLTEIKSFPDELKKDPVIHFYSANCNQNLANYKEAISLYSKVIDHGDNYWIEEARWNRILCYLVTDKEKAKLELIAVSERKGYYSDNADAILRRLKYSFR